MRQLSSVLWQEGMHLAQHHLQLQARYFENSVGFALSHLFFAPYGVADVEIDAAALRNGVLAVTRARGIMPDGLPFVIPDSDPAPAPRPIADALGRMDGRPLVLLAVPAYREDGANVAGAATPGAPGPGAAGNAAFLRDTPGSSAPDDLLRYVAETRTVRDDVWGREERPVAVGRKNLTLLLEGERADAGFVTLPIARLERDSAGHVVLDAQYVPPCLQLGASPYLGQVLRRLVDQLDAKSATLAGSRRATGRAAAYAPEEISTFWLLHTINASLAPLRHLLQAREAHPERLYLELARLAGALCTFGLGTHPRDLPLYDHARLGECVAALERHIQAHLDLVVPTAVAQIALRRTAESLFDGDVTDRRALGTARWVLGVRSEHGSLGEADLVERVPRLVKVCSGPFVRRLVQSALSGMTLTHLPAPPAALAPRVGTHYFAVSTAGPCWEHVRQSATVGVYVPAELPGAELELLALLGG